MLKIYGVMLDALKEMRPLFAEIERKDGDLARQMRRAAASVALNIAEGRASQGGNRRTRYYSAFGSAKETMACLDVAECLHGITAAAPVRDKLDHVAASLFNLTR